MVNSSCVALTQTWVDKFYAYHVLDMIFGILALLGNVLLTIVFLKFENLRKSYRLLLAIVCILDILVSLCDIFHKSMLFYVIDHRNRFDVNSFRWSFYVLLIPGLKSVLETTTTYLLVFAAGEIFIACYQCQIRLTREKVRYLMIAAAFAIGFLLQGSIFFHRELHQISSKKCDVQITVGKMQSWVRGNTFYWGVWRHWLLKFFTFFYPNAVYVALVAFIAHKAHKEPGVGNEYSATCWLLGWLGILEFTPNFLEFINFNIVNYTDVMFEFVFKFQFLIECAHFLNIFGFLALDLETRNRFLELYLTEKMRARVTKAANWIRARLFSYRRFLNENDGDARPVVNKLEAGGGDFNVL